MPLAPIPSDDRSELEKLIEASGGPTKFLERWRRLPLEERQAWSYRWRNVARKKQLAPAGKWRVWSVRAGRGWGKTRVGAEFVREEVEAGRAGRIALVGPTAADARDVMVEGQSGILAISPPWNRPHYEPSKRRVTWANGATATLYSAEEPDRLRGPQHDLAWADELAAWKRLDETWDNLQFGLRLGANPRTVVTSTPRPLAFLRRLEADPDTFVTIGPTRENAANLAAGFIKAIDSKYGGTRLGRQEIDAEILDDNPNALWRMADIEALRITPDRVPALVRRGIGVDPAVSANEDSDETGIVAAGKGPCWCKGHEEEHGFVLDDASGIYTPVQWAERVLRTYRDHDVDRVFGEVNQGGDLVEANLRAHPEARAVPFSAIRASKGKQLRHEPVASLYEQRKVHHVGVLGVLETQMTQWDPTMTKSPDRLDALTIVLTELMVEAAPPAYGRREKPILRTRM